MKLEQLYQHPDLLALLEQQVSLFKDKLKSMINPKTGLQKFNDLEINKIAIDWREKIHWKLIRTFTEWILETDVVYPNFYMNNGEVCMDANINRENIYYKLHTESINAGGDIQTWHKRYLVKTDLPGKIDGKAIYKRLTVLEKIRLLELQLTELDKKISKLDLMTPMERYMQYMRLSHPATYMPENEILLASQNYYNNHIKNRNTLLSNIAKLSK